MSTSAAQVPSTTPRGSARQRLTGWLKQPGVLRVPQVTVAFWAIKGLSTAMGESTSDYLVHVMAPELAVLLGFAAFVLALVLQLRADRYTAVRYWFAVVMVGIFGTMAADVLHVGLGVPYTATTILYAAVLAAVFVAWYLTERTLSVHTIDTPRRELFYWAAVVATFAMGTSLGDFTANTLHLGYFPSAIIFAVLIGVPAVGYRLLRWNGVFAFWFAYVVTRPLGASLADGFGKANDLSGLGYGDGTVSAVLGLVIIAAVAVLAVTRLDVQAESPSDTPPEPAIEPA